MLLSQVFSHQICIGWILLIALSAGHSERACLPYARDTLRTFFRSNLPPDTNFGDDSPGRIITTGLIADTPEIQASKKAMVSEEQIMYEVVLGDSCQRISSSLKGCLRAGDRKNLAYITVRDVLAQPVWRRTFWRSWFGAGRFGAERFGAERYRDPAFHHEGLALKGNVGRFGAEYFSDPVLHLKVLAL
ncbi:hypothetical protein RF11_16032 [Thelohanellus kitauei]|uniref:Uncharacterized protein n=1 Tax=Thelohanellus kitauei TaxID=669202 RepID=A0A0C2IMC3_THEKT|nr:hypothetical protein RF11_16032 [Thelohanellus kitauei]